MFDPDLKVCNYPKGRRGCSFLYTGEATDDGSSENDLINLVDNNENRRLVDEEDSNANNETAELDAQPPERSDSATEGSNAALLENLSNEDPESSEASW